VNWEPEHTRGFPLSITEMPGPWWWREAEGAKPAGHLKGKQL
jgi:hypothetical protein